MVVLAGGVVTIGSATTVTVATVEVAVPHSVPVDQTKTWKYVVEVNPVAVYAVEVAPVISV